MTISLVFKKESYFLCQYSILTVKIYSKTFSRNYSLFISSVSDANGSFFCDISHIEVFLKVKNKNLCLTLPVTPNCYLHLLLNSLNTCFKLVIAIVTPPFLFLECPYILVYVWNEVNKYTYKLILPTIYIF